MTDEDVTLAFGDQTLDDIPIGRTLGRYLVLAHVATGGMGRVLRAYDPKLCREVALKILRHSSSSDQARLQREAQAMARLTHPNVVQVYDVDDRDGLAFIAMEFIDGLTLREWLDVRRRDWREVIDVMVAAGRGLAAAHAVGIVHRDFKPSNVIVASDGRVRVTDFGLARGLALDEEPVDLGRELSTSLVDGLTQSGTTVGTPAYMAPEQHLATTPDDRCDQFAFCVSLYEAIWGAQPYVATDLRGFERAKRAGPPRPPSGVAPRWLAAVVLRGLAVDPAARWPHMGALLDALAGASMRRRRRMLAAVAGITVAGAAAFAFVHHRRTLCRDAAAPIESVWNERVRDEIGRAVLATDLAFAPGTWERLAPSIDQWATHWSEARAEACTATRVRGEQPESVLQARNDCLTESLAELDGLLASLTDPDETSVRNAVEAAAGMSPIQRCSDLHHVLTRDQELDDPELIRRVREQRAELAQVAALARTGRIDDANSRVEVVLERATELGHAPLLAEVALRRGVIAELGGHYPEAESNLRAAYFDAARIGYDAIAAEAGARLVFVIGWLLARPDEALAWSEHVKIAVERADQPRIAASLQDAIGSSYDAKGKVDLAIEAYRAAVDERERLESPVDLAATLNNLGTVLEQTGRYDEAEAVFERALTLWRDALGPEHPRVADALTNIAGLELRVGHDAAAEPPLREAVALIERSLGPTHPNLAGVLANLALALSGQQRWDDAEATFARALTLTEQSWGPEDARVASLLNNFAEMQERRGDSVTAAATYGRALAVGERALGVGHPRTGHPLLNLGRLARERGDLDTAQAMLERAHKAWAETPDTFDMAMVEYELALLARARERPADAADHLRIAIDICQRSVGAGNPLLLTPLAELVDVEIARGDRRGALALATASLALTVLQPGREGGRTQKAFVAALAAAR